MPGYPAGAAGLGIDSVKPARAFRVTNQPFMSFILLAGNGMTGFARMFPIKYAVPIVRCSMSLGERGGIFFDYAIYVLLCRTAPVKEAEITHK